MTLLSISQSLHVAEQRQEDYLGTCLGPLLPSAFPGSNCESSELLCDYCEFCSPLASSEYRSNCIQLLGYPVSGVSPFGWIVCDTSGDPVNAFSPPRQEICFSHPVNSSVLWPWESVTSQIAALLFCNIIRHKYLTSHGHAFWYEHIDTCFNIHLHSCLRFCD